jgi:hypothetical protein
MNKNDIIKYLAIAGGVYAVYWYINNYGPNGAVYDTTGNAVQPSYWSTWFGTAAPVTPGQTPAQIAAAQALITAQATGNQAAAAKAAADKLAADQAAQVAASSSAAIAAAQAAEAKALTGASLRASLMKAANVPEGSFLNVDQWSYYYNQIKTPLTSDQFQTAFLTPVWTGANIANATAPMPVDRAAPLTVDQYLQKLGTVGLSGLGDVVPVGSRPQIPMMTFGGAFNSPFPTKKGWA